MCAEKLPVPQKEQFFLTEALKKFEDVHETPVDVVVEDDAKSESSLLAQQEKALSTMYVEDDPDNPKNVLMFLPDEPGPMSMPRGFANKLIKSASPEKEKPEKPTRGRGRGQSKAEGKRITTAGRKQHVGKKVPGQSGSGQPVPVDKAASTPKPDGFDDYWYDDDFLNILVANGIMVDRDTEKKLVRDRKQEKAHIVFRVDTYADRLAQLKAYDDKIVNDYVQRKKNRAEQSEATIAEQEKQTVDPAVQGQNTAKDPVQEKDTDHGKTDDGNKETPSVARVEDTQSTVVTDDKGDGQEDIVEIDTGAKETGESSGAIPKVNPKKRSLSSLFTLRTRETKRIARDLEVAELGDYEDDDEEVPLEIDFEHETLDEAVDHDIIPPSGNQNPVRVAAQQKLVEEEAARALLLGKGAVQVPTTHMDPALDAFQQPQQVDLAIVKQEKKDTDDDVIMVEDEELTIKEKKVFLKKQTETCVRCLEIQGSEKCHNHRVQLYHLMCQEAEDLDYMKRALNEDISQCTDCADSPFFVKVCTLHRDFMDKLEHEIKERKRKQEFRPIPIKKEKDEDKKDDDQDGKGSGQHPKGPPQPPPPPPPPGAPEAGGSGQGDGVLVYNIVPLASQDTGEDVAEAWSLGIRSSSSSKVGVNACAETSQHIEPASTQPFEISGYFTNTHKKMPEYLQAQKTTGQPSTGDTGKIKDDDQDGKGSGQHPKGPPQAPLPPPPPGAPGVVGSSQGDDGKNPKGPTQAPPPPPPPPRAPGAVGSGKGDDGQHPKGPPQAPPPPPPQRAPGAVGSKGKGDEHR